MFSFQLPLKIIEEYLKIHTSYLFYDFQRLSVPKGVLFFRMNKRRVFIIILLFTRFSIGLCKAFDWKSASLEWKEKWGKEEKLQRSDWKLFLGCATMAVDMEEKGRAAQDDQVFRECVRGVKEGEEYKEDKFKAFRRWHYPFWEIMALVWKDRWEEEEERLEWQIFLGCASLRWKDENSFFEPCVKRAKMEAEQELLQCMYKDKLENCMLSFEL